MRFDPDGTFKQTWGTKGDGPGQFDLVHNIVIDKAGRVYIADRENERLQIFDADGKFIEQWMHVGKPYGLYLDDRTNVYITDGESNKVYVTDRTGKVLTSFGTTGDCDKKGNIYVAEGDGMRIQLFAPKK